MTSNIYMHTMNYIESVFLFTYNSHIFLGRNAAIKIPVLESGLARKGIPKYGIEVSCLNYRNL